jgi:hypothetical protein
MTPMPRDWYALGARGTSLTPPLGAFDPHAAGSLSYVRHTLSPEIGGAPGGTPAGSLTLTLKPAGDELTVLAAEVIPSGLTSMTAEAEILCSKDTLLTPKRWSLSLRWQTPPQSGAAKGEMDQKRTGRADGKELVFAGAKERRRPAPEHWTCFWNLFSVVQRLPFEAEPALCFDLFEEMDLHKPGQRLAYMGRQPFTAGGKTLNLHVFEQTGHGMLPWRWWLDDQHRVLLAAGGRRAYLLDTTSKGGAA